MPIHITSDAWARWQPVIEELYANYDFPFNTRRNLNALLALYGGEGFSIRNTRDRWRFVMDTIRSGDAIEDVVSISVIARGQKMGLEGWVINRKCDIHNVESPNKAVEGRDLTWFKVTSDGRSFQHCCREEVTGPFPAHVPWRSWESTRLTINQRSLSQEIVSLRHELEEQKNDKSTKRKASEVIVIDDDIEDSPTAKRLRKSKAKAAKYKDAKAEAEDRAISLEEEITNLRAELLEQKMLVTQKDKTMDDLRREYAVKDVSLQSLRDQVARQKNNKATLRTDSLEKHLESAMKIDEDEIDDLRTENNMLKSMVDSQNTEMEHVKARLSHLEDTKVPELLNKMKIRNRMLEKRRKQVHRLHVFMNINLPHRKIPDDLQIEDEVLDSQMVPNASIQEPSVALNSSKKEIHELKEMLKAREDKIKTMKQSHLQVKAQLESENQRLQTSNARLQQDFDALRRRAQDTEGGLQRLTDRLSDDKTEMQLARDCIRQVEKIRFATYEQLEKERNEFKKFCHMTGGEVADKDSRIRDLQQQLTRLQEQPPKSKQRLVIKLPMPSSSHLSKEEGRHGGALDSIDASNGKGNSLTSGRDEVSSLKNELEETKNDLLNKSDKIVQLEKQLAQYLSIIKNNAYTAMQSSDKHHQLVHLEKELETTRQELKSRTDELASATEKHAQELKETGGTEGKCACKDKEPYLNSVEGHVESLRGAMEEVLSKGKEHRENMRETMEIALRRVSMFQGRKRRRTEGGDFDY